MTMTPPDPEGPDPDTVETDEDDETVNIPNEDTVLETEGDPDLPGDPVSPPPASPGVS